jgi:outer membrane protein assembly factor BamA
LEVDTRDNPAYPTSGMRVEASGEVFPALLDADEAFGRVEGRLSGYLTPWAGAHAPTLAMRLGAARAFGAFPFHEAAFLGGRRDLRGSREQRFAGEGALFANLEARVPVWAFDLLFPTELGIHGVIDTGRVFHGDDPSPGAPWQRAYGGGLWLSFLERTQTLGVTLVQGRERLGVYVGGGFHF